MHHLAGDRVANAADLVAHHDLVASELQLRLRALRLRQMIGPGPVAVAGIEDVALACVKRGPRPREDLLAHRAHQLHVEADVVQPHELRRLRIVRRAQMAQVGD
jgi:hypothetical protein